MGTHFICLAITTILLCPFASAQWVETNGPHGGDVGCLAVMGTNLFAGVGGFVLRPGVYRSTDNGTSWDLVADRGITGDMGVQALAVSGSSIFASVATYDIVVRSTNNGTDWIKVNSGLPQYTDVFAFAVSGTNLFIGTDYGIFLSTNDGTSWTSVNSGLPLNIDVIAFGVSGRNLFACVFEREPSPFLEHIYLSTNNGTSWTEVLSGELGGYGIRFAIIDHNILAGGNGHLILRSIDNGSNWTHLNSAPYDVSALCASGANLFAGTTGGVFLSANNGTSWTAFNSGLSHDACISSFAVCGGNLFAGTLGPPGSGVWRRPLSEMITAVDLVTSGMPHEFLLNQNYPNPFNPSTSIRYGLPHKSQVSLMVYNTLGQQVATLVEGEQNAGYHEVRFDASGLSSGVYFYRLQAGTFVETRKLLLLR